MEFFANFLQYKIAKNAKFVLALSLMMSWSNFECTFEI